MRAAPSSAPAADDRRTDSGRGDDERLDPERPDVERRDDPDDRDLARRVERDGDEEAFRLLFRRHTPALLAFVQRSGNLARPRAEDLVQDVWMRAVDGLGRFAWRSSLRTWLTGIALNRVREELRRLSRRREDALEDLDGDRRFGDGDPERPRAELHAVPAEALGVDLERALAALPEGYRTAILLHDVQGFTHGEIAAILGVTAGTSRSQLHHARKALRAWFQPAADQTHPPTPERATP